MITTVDHRNAPRLIFEYFLQQVFVNIEFVMQATTLSKEIVDGSARESDKLRSTIDASVSTALTARSDAEVSISTDALWTQAKTASALCNEIKGRMAAVTKLAEEIKLFGGEGFQQTMKENRDKLSAIQMALADNTNDDKDMKHLDNCARLTAEIISQAATAVAARHAAQLAALNDAGGYRLAAAKEHLEALRYVYMSAGKLLYHLERKLEHTDRNIRTTHIQLELCIETFDPKAKKYSDEKKQLYIKRVQVEEEMAFLKEMLATSLSEFDSSGALKMLDDAGIEFVHPVDELREARLSWWDQSIKEREELMSFEEKKSAIDAEREAIAKAKKQLEGAVK